MRSPSLEGWVGQEQCTSQRCEGLRAVAIAGLEPDVRRTTTGPLRRPRG
jgi:hypothetical protein